MNIGLLHFRIGATDGVSLEMEKWKLSLESMGHTVHYITGESFDQKAFTIPELSIQTPHHHMIFKNSYESLEDFASEADLITEIESAATRIEKALKKIIFTASLDILIPNNVASLGLHLPAAVGLSRALRSSQVEVIYHHHDFYWERKRYAKPTVPAIQRYLDTYFPDATIKATHCVINHIAKKELQSRKALDSVVVPNVFDFNQPQWCIDEYNKSLITSLNIQPEDLVFLQATRIEDRKAIELTLDFLEAFSALLPEKIGQKTYKNLEITKDTTIHLIMPGLNELRADKWQLLKAKMDASAVQIHLINQQITANRQTVPVKTFALWDVYPLADFVTYPSILEGWGNQLLEAIFAKKPIMIYEYPVYETDLKSIGFDLISLGHAHSTDAVGLVKVKSSIINDAATKAWATLLSQSQYESKVQNNFAKAKASFSYQNLDLLLKNIINTNIKT